MFEKGLALAKKFWQELVEFVIYCTDGPINLPGILIFKLTGEPIFLSKRQTFHRLSVAGNMISEGHRLHRLMWNEAIRRGNKVDSKGTALIYYAL